MVPFDGHDGRDELINWSAKRARPTLKIDLLCVNGANEAKLPPPKFQPWKAFDSPSLLGEPNCFFSPPLPSPILPAPPPILGQQSRPSSFPMAHFLSLLVENVTASMMWVVRIHMRHWNHNSSLDRAQSVFPSTLHKVSHHPQTEAVVVLSASLSDLSSLQLGVRRLNGFNFPFVSHSKHTHSAPSPRLARNGAYKSTPHGVAWQMAGSSTCI